MKKTLLLSFATCLALTGFYSCKTTKHAVAVNCGDARPTYITDIKPILDTHCAADCHSAKNTAGGIDLSSYEGAKDISGKKKFLGAIRHEFGYPPMPKKNPKLADEDITKIACWVQNGSAQ